MDGSSLNRFWQKLTICARNKLARIIDGSTISTAHRVAMEPYAGNLDIASLLAVSAQKRLTHSAVLPASYPPQCRRHSALLNPHHHPKVYFFHTIVENSYIAMGIKGLAKLLSDEAPDVSVFCCLRLHLRLFRQQEPTIIFGCRISPSNDISVHSRSRAEVLAWTEDCC